MTTPCPRCNWWPTADYRPTWSELAAAAHRVAAASGRRQSLRKVGMFWRIREVGA